MPAAAAAAPVDRPAAVPGAERPAAGGRSPVEVARRRTAAGGPRRNLGRGRQPVPAEGRRRAEGYRQTERPPARWDAPASNSFDPPRYRALTGISSAPRAARPMEPPAVLPEERKHSLAAERPAEAVLRTGLGFGLAGEARACRMCCSIC